MDTFLHGHFVDALFEDKYNSTLRAMQGGGPLQLHLPEQCRQGNEICHIPDKKQIKAQSNQEIAQPTNTVPYQTADYCRLL